jgi:hypothetical protein
MPDSESPATPPAHPAAAADHSQPTTYGLGRRTGAGWPTGLVDERVAIVVKRL